MNRQTMRRLLRSRLGDEAAIDFTDDILNEALNEGIAYVQQSVMLVDPTAFVKVTVQDVLSGVARYRKPEGIWSLLKLKRKDTSVTPNIYRSMGDPTDDDTLDTVALAALTAQGSLPRWGHLGEFIRIAPVPAATLTDGLEWTWIYTCAMAEDDDVLALHLGLHNAVVLRAQIVLAPETTSEGLAEVRKQLEEELARVPLFYRRDVGHTTGLAPRIDKMSNIRGSR